MFYIYDYKNLQFKPVSLKHYIYWITLFLFMLVSLSSGVTTKIVYDTLPVVIRYETIPFTEDNLKSELTKLNIKFPNVVYKQCIIEGASKTGERWKNPYFVHGNNLLGLKRAYLRPSTAINWREDNYCIYNSWRDCIIDYSLYQAQNLRNINTEKEYIRFLNEMGYSVDNNYTNLIQQIK